MKKRIFGIVIVLCMVLTFVPTTVFAAGNVSYLDENGVFQTCTSATEVTSGDTEWTAGWYVVNSDVEIGSRVTVSGIVHLILTDGCTLTVNGGIQVQDNSTESTPNTNALTIYAQSVPVLNTDGTVDETQNTAGKLIATGGSFNAGIGGSENGGGAGIGGGDGMSGGDGGTVTATGNNGGNGTGIGGSFRTQIGGEANGNAVIYTSSIEDKSDQNNWSGIIFLNWSSLWTGSSRSGTVYGKPTLTSELTIPGGDTLNILTDASLTIPARYALSIQDGTTLINNGTLYSNGSSVGTPGAAGFSRLWRKMVKNARENRDFSSVNIVLQP